MRPYILRYLITCLISIFMLVACGGGGGSDDSANDGGGGPQNTPLSAPTNVQASGQIGHINLSWSSVSGVESYKIYFSSSPGVDTNDSSFTGFGTGTNHQSLSAGDTYYYAISAVSSSEESGLSNEVSATVQAAPNPPQAPSTIQASGSDSSIRVEWTNVDNATSYNVYYNTTGSVSTSDTQVTNVSSPLDISSLSNGTEYYLRVEAVNSDGAALSDSDVLAIADIRPSIKNYAPWLRGAAYNGSLHVMVGDGGSIYTSVDAGVTKVRQESPTTVSLNAVAYGAGTFVAVGGNGVILTSTDGVTWQKQLLGSGAATTNLIFANNKFYGIGQSTLMLSTDGSTWTTQDHSSSMCNTEVENDNYLEHITYGGGKLAVTATTGCVKTTTDDGTTWSANSASSSETQEFLGMTHNGTEFVMLSRDNGPVIQIHSSSDGVSWSTTTTSGLTGPAKLHFNNGIYVTSDSSGGGLNMLYSTDKTNWTAATYSMGGDPSSVFSFVDHDGSQFFAVGGDVQFITSTNGMLWSNTSNDVIDDDLNFILYDGDTYIAISGQGALYTSSNLTTWTLQHDFIGSLGAVTDVIIVNNILTVTGYTGSSSSGPAFVANANTSTDYSTGNWTSADVSNTPAIYDITYDSTNGRYIVGNNITLAYNGSNPWDNSINMPFNVPYRQVETDGTNVITTTGSNVYHNLATNIADWSGATTIDMGSSVSQFYEHNNTFYAFTGAGIQSSADGLTWSNINANPKLTLNGGITFDGTNHIIVGDNSHIVSTSDLISETVRGGQRDEANGLIHLRDVAWDGSQLIFVGVDGYIGTHPGY